MHVTSKDVQSNFVISNLIWIGQTLKYFRISENAIHTIQDFDTIGTICVHV